MSKTRDIQVEGNRFTLETPDAVPQLYVDGMTSLAVGYPLSKLLFHYVVPPLPEKDAPTVPEHRVAALQMTVPTAALFDMCFLILRGARANGDQLGEAATRVVTNFQAQIQRLGETETQGKVKK